MLPTIFEVCVLNMHFITKKLGMLLKKTSPENFGIKTKDPKNFLMIVRLLHFLELDQSDPSGQLTVSDETKNPPKTFETAKVPLRHPNRYS